EGEVDGRVIYERVVEGGADHRLGRPGEVHYPHVGRLRAGERRLGDRGRIASHVGGDGGVVAAQVQGVVAAPVRDVDRAPGVQVVRVIALPDALALRHGEGDVRVDVVRVAEVGADDGAGQAGEVDHPDVGRLRAGERRLGDRRA